MDERKLWQKSLKRAYKRARRKYVTPWKSLCFLFLLIAALLLSGKWVIPVLGQWIPGFTALAGQRLAAYFQMVYTTYIGMGVTGGVLVLCLLMLILWSCGKGRLRKSAGYLDYMTMKRAQKEYK